MDRRREFDPDPSVLSGLRAWVCDVAGVELHHPAVLVASELAANAIAHTGAPFTVAVRRNPAIHIEVADRSGIGLGTVSPDGGGGYGLRIVAALAQDWGVDMQNDGKTVWAVVPL